MANITVTHTFANSTVADATEINTNYSDIIAGTSDSTKDFSINNLTVAGTATLNGNVVLGNATGDTITFTGRIATDLDPTTTATYALGSTSLTWTALFLDNGATDGGAIYFNASATAFIKSDASAGDLDISGFTDVDFNAVNLKGSGNYTFTGTMSHDGAAVFNESGNPVDFRIEGDTEVNLFFVDASADAIGIKTSSPQAPLHIFTSSSGEVEMARFSSSSSTGAPYVRFAGADSSFDVGYNDSSNKFFINDSTGTVELYIDKATGDLELGVGDISIDGAAGKGVIFTNGGNEALSYYASGTWTPAWGGATSSTAAGDYVRIGRLVWCTFRITTTSAPSSGTLSGLPFTAATDGSNEPGGGSIFYNTHASADQQVSISIPSATATGEFYTNGDSPYSGDTGITIYGTFTYMV